MKIKSLSTFEVIVYLLLFTVFFIGIYFSNTHATYFETVYVKEDGIVEYLTAFLLFCIGMLSLSRIIFLRKYKNLLWFLGTVFFTIVFLFGAGEEISWGQRIFNFDSSNYFIENNTQQETNLHNMVVGETKINKLIFSQLLTLIMVVYLLVLPVLFRKYSWIKNLTNRFAVPVVKWHHSIYFLLITASLMLIPSDKKWELYELAFGVIFFLIFLKPFNKNIFTK